MAKFKMELPTDLIKQVNKLNANYDEVFGKVTKAGAEKVKSIIEATAPNQEIASRVKLSKTYRTPSDVGINTKVYIFGYIPFSDPNRKYFARKGGNGKMYYTSDGVPADFLAKLYEYGRKDKTFPKKPFVRKAFKNSSVEQAMLDEQQKQIERIFGL